MSIQAICPKCDQSQKVPDAQAGKRIRCKGCDHAFVVQVEEEVMVVEAVEEDEDETRVVPRKPRKQEADQEERVVSRKPRNQEAVLDEVELADDEEPFEDEKPAKKKGGGGGIVLILLGVAAGLLLLCGGGVAGGVYLVVAKSRDTLQQAEADLNKEKDKSIPDPNKDKSIPDPNKDKSKQPDPNKDKSIPDPNKDKSKQPDPDKDKSKQPPDDFVPPKDVTSALVLLQDPKFERQQAGVRFLAATPVEESRRQDVVKALQPLQSNFRLRTEVTTALTRWSPPETLDTLANKLDSEVQNDWQPAMDKLSKMNDERAAELLGRQLELDKRAFHASDRLVNMGAMGEKQLLARYNHPVSRDHARRGLDRLGVKNDPRVKQCVADLDSTEKMLPDQTLETARKQKRANAFEGLQRLKPTNDTEVNASVSRHLEAALADKDLSDKAFDSLQTWATKDNVKALLEIGTKDKTKTERVIQLLTTKFPEHELVTPVLIQRLADGLHRHSAHKALVSIGDKAETAILKLDRKAIFASDVATRRALYDVLRDVGTKRSADLLNYALKYEIGKKDKVAQKHAADALAAVNLRAAPPKEKDKDKQKEPDKDKQKDQDKAKDKPKDK